MPSVKVVPGKRGKYLLRWTQNGKSKERTTQLDASKRNYKDALKLASQLELELSGDSPPNLMLTTRQRDSFKSNRNDPSLPSSADGNWKGFRQYFFKTHLSGLSSGYGETMGPILDRFERFAKPEYLSDVSASTFRRWFAHLRDDELSENTIKSYWGHLRSFLSIALDDGLIKSVPRVRLPKIDSDDLAKGRPLTGEEFDRMLEAAKKLKNANVKEFKYFLSGMWLAGLRISEAYRLTWDESDFYVDLDRKRPMFVIRKQKNKKNQLLPMTPDYVEHLRETKSIRRHGYVYRITHPNGQRMKQDYAERRVSDCGEESNILTGKTKKNGDPKTASAQDLRRSFGARWALKVLPQVLQKLMRHSSIETTMKYYAHLDAERLADQLYESQNYGQKGGQQPKPKKSKKRSEA